MKVLVVNAGSSSLKYQLLDTETEALLAKGICERIGEAVGLLDHKKYSIEGGEEKLNEQSGCPDGTTFVVKDLFYNIPARLKFLKKDTTEGNYVAEIVTKLTLSHPEISFKFIRDNKVELLSAGDGKTYTAVYSVFGRDFAQSLVPVDYTWKGIHISGYTVRPLESKTNRKFQNFFVNSRYIKSLACSCALEDAYRNQIMVGKFPACVLYIDIAPNTVDVNVHPTKIQVRFSNESLMHEAVYFAVKDALLKITAEKREHDLEVECLGHLSWIYQLTEQYFLAWHIEERLLAIADCEEDAALALYNMMCIAINGNDMERARKALKQYDQLQTNYLADEVKKIRKPLQ